MLFSAYNKITYKTTYLQRNYSRKKPEDWQKRSPTTEDIKENHNKTGKRFGDAV